MSTIQMKVIVGIVFFAAVSAVRLEGSVLYMLSESANGVQITYTGSLNTSLFSPQGGV